MVPNLFSEDSWMVKKNSKKAAWKVLTAPLDSTRWALLAKDFFPGKTHYWIKKKANEQNQCIPIFWITLSTLNLPSQPPRSPLFDLIFTACWVFFWCLPITHVPPPLRPRAWLRSVPTPARAEGQGHPVDLLPVVGGAELRAEVIVKLESCEVICQKLKTWKDWFNLYFSIFPSFSNIKHFKESWKSWLSKRQKSNICPF